MASSELLSTLQHFDDTTYTLTTQQQLDIISSLGGITKILKFCLHSHSSSTDNATDDSDIDISDKQCEQILDIINHRDETISNPATMTKQPISSNTIDLVEEEKMMHSEATHVHSLPAYHVNLHTASAIEEDEKLRIMAFCTEYGNANNWKLGKKEQGVQKYVLQFDERQTPIQVRMSFLYSMTLYLANIIGINKRCISHAFILCKSSKSQIQSLSEEFKLINRTLLHHNDDALWSYFYHFMMHFLHNFKHIEKYIGTRTDV